GDGRGRKDGEHHAFVPSPDPTLSRSQRAIHRAMQRGAEDRVGGTERQMFGLRDKGRSRVVDEYVDRRVVPERIHHGIDCAAITNIAPDRSDLAAGIAAHPSRLRLQELEPAAADEELGTQLQEAASHRRTKPRAAAGDQDPLSRQQVLFKHVPFLPVPPSFRTSLALDPESRDYYSNLRHEIPGSPFLRAPRNDGILLSPDLKSGKKPQALSLLPKVRCVHESHSLLAILPTRRSRAGGRAGSRGWTGRSRDRDQIRGAE